VREAEKWPLRVSGMKKGHRIVNPAAL